MHRQETRIQNIDLIDFFGSNNAHSPSHSITLYLFTERLAFLVSQLFAIIEVRVLIIGRKNHCCSIDATSQTPSARLIATRLNHILIIMTF